MAFTAQMFYRGSRGYERELVTTQARADELVAAGWNPGEAIPSSSVEADVVVQGGHAYVDVA